MHIDIISYTDVQFAALTEEQLLEVKNAQLKKNRLEDKLNEDLQKERQRLIENGIFLSTIFPEVERMLWEASQDSICR